MLTLRHVIKNNPIIGQNEDLKKEIITIISKILEDNILLSKDECIYIAALNDWNLIENLFERQQISSNLQEHIFIYYLHKKNYEFFNKIHKIYNLSLLCQEFSILLFSFKNNIDCDFILDLVFNTQLYKEIPNKQLSHIAYYYYNTKYTDFIIKYLIEYHQKYFENYIYDLFENPNEIIKAINFIKLKNIDFIDLQHIYEKISSYYISKNEFEESYFNYLYQNFPIDLSFKNNILLQNSLIILNEEFIDFLVSHKSVIEKIDEEFIHKQRHSMHYQQSKIFLEEIIIKYKIENF